MNTVKNRILDRLHSASVTAVDTSPGSASVWRSAVYNDPHERLMHFTQALTANHAQVRVIRSVELSDTFESLCEEKGWRHAATGTGGWYLKAIHQGLSAIRVTPYTEAFEAWKDELFQSVDVGITHSVAGIADTGAVVLKANVQEPRTLSLIPPCHVVIVRQSDLFSSLTEVMREQEWARDMPANLLLITGPSKTADIQRTIAYGAHGPAAFIVLLLTDQ